MLQKLDAFFIDKTKKGIKARASFVYFFLILLVIAIGWRLVHIKFVKGDYWRSLITDNTFKYKDITPNRGNILAADGSILATTLSEFWIIMDTKVASNSKFNQKIYDKNIDAFCKGLEKIIGEKTASGYKAMIENAAKANKHDLKLNTKKIDFLQYIKIRELELAKISKYKGGVYFEEELIRSHPFGNMALRTIGNMSTKNILEGRGLEASFDSDLAGEKGYGLHETIKGGKDVLMENGKYKKPIEGYDIHTTIDINIQDEAETALKRACEQYQPEYGSVVVMEVATGEIKAMANLSYSKALNRYAEGTNFAISASTTPGSTMKGPTMLALIEEGVDNSDSVNTGSGTLSFKGGFSLNDHGGHGFITAQRAMEKSSNVGIVKLTMEKFGQRPSKFYDYLDKFGLTKPIGFQMKGESTPVFYRPGTKRYSNLSLPWTAFGGYESAVSPLQILTFYNAVANDGYWVQPIIVKHAKKDGVIMKDYTLSQRKYPERIANKTSIDKLKKMLEGVVQNGTAKAQKSEVYNFAGKTGTSIKNKKSTGIKPYYCAFVGYFPAENPRYSCIVVIDEPKGKSSNELMAADVAAPVFRQIADHVYADDLTLAQNNTLEKTPVAAIKRNFALLNDFRFVKNAFPKSDLKLKDVAVNANVKSPKYKTPNVTGLPLRDALYVLENKDFKIKFEGQGKVVKQSIKSGAMVPAGETISLVLN